MKRVVVGALGLAVLVVAVLFPAWVHDSGSIEEVYEPTTISRYSASFDVAEDGSMQVVETVVVRVSTSDRHGIFRFFDVADPNAPELRRVPRDVSVEQDGVPAQVEELTEDFGRYQVLKIGDPDATLTLGEHTYRIAYTIDDVLLPDDGEGSRFYWNLVPGGWAQQIEEARLTVQLPAPTEDVRCVVGTVRTAKCLASGEGTTSVTVGLADLSPNTPVTVRADVAQPVPATRGETYPWSATWDPVLAPVPWVVVVTRGAFLRRLVAKYPQPVP